MEFETNTTSDVSGDISDEARLAASSRVNVVTPAHEDVVPEDPSDDYSVNQRILQGPIANLPIDSEATIADTAPLANPIANYHSRTPLWVSLGVVVTISAAAGIWLILPH